MNYLFEIIGEDPLILFDSNKSILENSAKDFNNQCNLMNILNHMMFKINEKKEKP